MSPTQIADEIIEEEKLTNDPIVDDPKEEPVKFEEPPEPKEQGNPENPEQKTEEPEEESEPKEQPKEDPKDIGPTASERVEHAKSLIGQLNLSEENLFDAQGNPKKFEDVVPAGEYLHSQLTPVVVMDKDGKKHEFLLLDDLEKQFPDGFEAKNNVEQMKLERGIMRNEDAFEKGVQTYKNAKEQYGQEVGQISNVRESNQRLGAEYMAMAKAGLVPAVDQANPGNKESEAVKEMDRILTWMQQKNEENAKLGLGEINSLWVAKSLMDQETDPKKNEKEEKKQQVIEERRSVASLSQSPTNSSEKKHKQGASSLPMAQYVETLIAEEGLK